MNLTIDVGNTCTKLVAFEGLRPVDEVRMDERDTDVLHRFCCQHDFERGIYSTVVRLPDNMSAAINALPFPMMQLVSGVTPIPIRNLYATPQTLGSDRLAAAIGAYCKDTGHDVLVIDVGTCITYDFVNAQGEYLGGNISPGPTLRIKALHAFTDKLPMIERKGVCPDLGNTTETAIRSGVMTGVRREIEGYIRDYLLKSPGLLVYLTGGVHLDLRISEKMRIFADDFIVPEGLNRILLYNEELNKQ